jgi:hypothetical protein
MIDLAMLFFSRVDGQFSLHTRQKQFNQNLAHTQNEAQ